jgi:hypothetical protein
MIFGEMCGPTGMEGLDPSPWERHAGVFAQHDHASIASYVALHVVLYSVCVSWCAAVGRDELGLTLPVSAC